MQRDIPSGMGSGQAPVLVRLGGKFVLEVLPAALASAIGAFLFAQYQFDRGAPPAHAVTPAVAVPASAEMLQLVREEHAMIRDFLTAQRTAERNRAAAADAADAQAASAQATADAKLTAAMPARTAPPSSAKPSSPRRRIVLRPLARLMAPPPRCLRSSLPERASARADARCQRPPDATALIVAPMRASATAQPGAGLWPPAPPPAQPSIVAETLAVPGHVVSVTLHAVMAIGGIPSWFGHRFGDDDSAVARPSSAAS